MLKKLGKYFVLLSITIGFIAGLHANEYKRIAVGNLDLKVVDHAVHFGVLGEGWGQQAFIAFDNFTQPTTQSRGWHVGAKVVENSDTVIVTAGGGPAGFSEDFELERSYTLPIPNEERATITRYFRADHPEIMVDDVPLTALEFTNDFVNRPDKTGPAEVMVESKIRTPVGITVHQKAYGFDEPEYDDFVIFDLTFTNTGNIDLDEEIEYDRTLHDVYYYRQMNHGRLWFQRMWHSYYGQFPSDSLQITYSYPSRPGSHTFDILGFWGLPESEIGDLNHVWSMGEALLHVDASTDDPTHDPGQIHMTAFHRFDYAKRYTVDPGPLYTLMSEGIWPLEQASGIEMFIEADGIWPGTHHQVPPDQMNNILHMEDVNWGWNEYNQYSVGPYDLEPGESFRVVYAVVYGWMDREKAWDVGQAWKAGNATFPDMTKPLAPPHDRVVAAAEWSPIENDIAKDLWVYSGIDSLFKNASSAKYIVDNDYSVSVAPRAPSVQVFSRPDFIRVTWGDESEQDPGFAGYRVYRSVGQPDPTVQKQELVGGWEPVFTTEAANLTHEFLDSTTVERGQSYYYYVAAFNDQDQESGKYRNRTIEPASLTRPPKTLSDVKVVPNPFHLRAGEEQIQFVGEPNKIMFLDLPPVCTIRIYSESGDLVKTIEHTDGSGDEPWGVLEEEHLSTRSGQRVVSGIYIALIETPEGESGYVKFVVVR